MAGFLIVLLSSVFFCLQNIVVRVLFQEQTILGAFQTGGFVAPTFQNSFLLMFLRMVVVVPLMAAIMPTLHADTWQDFRRLRQQASRPALLRAIAGGGLMFLYLALLYVSIGLIPTGIALTLFFTYPVFTALFAWGWFGARPSPFRWGVMGLILLGSVLTMPHSQPDADSSLWLGVTLGIASGVVYALYTVNAQKSFETLHPVPFTWMSFAVALVLSAVSLGVWPVQETGLAWPELWIGSLISAIATLTGHLLNNFGIRLVGATTASMVGATNPALTVLVAWFAIQETLNGLQVLGIIVVTFSVALLSRDRSLHKQTS